MKRVICIVVVLAAILMMLSGCAGWQRTKKSFASDISGGLHRTLTVYDYNGNEIRSWTGKIDVDNMEDRTVFDMDGKRTVIRGGIIIIQED